MWKPPSVETTDRTPGPSVRPSAWLRSAASTAAMQSGSESSSYTAARDSTRMDRSLISALLGDRRVEALEQRHALREHLVVVARRGQQGADGHVDAARLLVRILAVAQVRLVHDLGEMDQAPVPQPRLLDERLERAVLAPVTQLDARGIEGNRVGRKRGRRREHEHRLGIDEALDEPGRREAVHVGPRPGDPASAAHPGEIEDRTRLRRGVLRASCTHGDGLLETPDLGARGGVEEVDVTDPLMVL